MEVVYYALTVFFIITAVLPFVSNQHWVFRIFDFARIQMMFLHVIMLFLGFQLIEDRNRSFWLLQSVLTILIVYSVYKLIPYTRFYPVKKIKQKPEHITSNSILSINVYQFNNDYGKPLDLIHEINPDIILTMETNKAWEKALLGLDKKYKNFKKIAQENTYGMHFYTRLHVTRLEVNHYTADDVPSVEVDMETSAKEPFTFFGIHPPPPSPTEEENSKERDSELLSVAKKVRKLNRPVLVVGDFNNVAWAKSSILFRKTSNLIDPRVGRGFLSTYHAKHWWFRFPIDLFFHSSDVFVDEFKTLRKIGSDHLPMYCTFFINKESPVQEEEIEDLDDNEISETNEMIREGKEEKSDRPKVAEKKTPL